VCASRCASAGWSSSVHPSGISVPTFLQHAPSEPALLSWERFQVMMWSSLAPLLPCLHDTVLGDISSPCVSATNWVSNSSTRFICSALDDAYPTLRPFAFEFRGRLQGVCVGVDTLRCFWSGFAMCAAGAACRLRLLDAR